MASYETAASSCDRCEIRLEILSSRRAKVSFASSRSLLPPMRERFAVIILSLQSQSISRGSAGTGHCASEWPRVSSGLRTPAMRGLSFMHPPPIGYQNKILIILFAGLTSITLLACGFVLDGGIRRPATPTPTAAAYIPSKWESSLDVAGKLHRSGQFSKAILLYEETLEALPNDDDYLAIRAGTYISKGEAHLMLGDGNSAIEAAENANVLLWQDTAGEQRSPEEWLLKMGQAMTVAGAALLIQAGDSGFPVDQYIQLLQSVTETVDLPEIHFFLGVGYAEAGRSAESKREFELFLNSPDLVTFTSAETMRDLALKSTSLTAPVAYQDPRGRSARKDFLVGRRICGYAPNHSS